MSLATKKRKTKDCDAGPAARAPPRGETLSRSTHDKSNGGNGTTTTAHNTNTADVLASFEPLTLEDIRSRLESLCERIPDVPANQFAAAPLQEEAGTSDEDATIKPENGNHNHSNQNKNCSSNLDETLVRNWATQLQAVLEEFNLLVCCVATASYKWGTERSGAADQNLTLLSGELASSQEQLSSAVTPRLTNVLAPLVDLVVEKTITIKPAATATPNKNTTTNDAATTTEIKEHFFTRKVVDPEFVQLCHVILARNAPLLRHVVLSNFHKLLHALKDYLQAQKSDSNTDREFAY
jgi:hypothetical protein